MGFSGRVEPAISPLSPIAKARAALNSRASGRVGASYAPLGVAALVIASATLAVYWVFLVPIFQSPDEPGHLDYIFNLYSSGRLISVREPLRVWNTPVTRRGRWGRGKHIFHVYTNYLITATDTAAIMFHPDVKAPPDYGTAAFYRRLDDGRPRLDSGELDGQARGQFGVLWTYPFGYYSLAAGWLSLVSRFSDRITVLFFSARLLSVILLGCSLTLAYATARELRFSYGRSLLLTGVIAFLPVTTFVSSYVQPDNLSFTLVSLCLYLALAARRRPASGAGSPSGMSSATALLLILLGMALGMLLVTKYHYYLCVAGPVACSLFFDRGYVARLQGGWRRLALTLALPSIAFGAVQLWVSWGAQADIVRTDSNLGHVAASQAMSRGVGAFAGFIFDGLRGAIVDFYLGGKAFTSYWGQFGWLDTPLVIGSPAIDRMIKVGIQVLTVIILVLSLARLGRVLARLARLAGRGRRGRALALLCGNPLLNSYFAFTGFMLVFYAWTSDAFTAQGRNWLPLMLPGLLISTWYAPRALRHRRARKVFEGLVLTGLALYCALGSYYAIPALRERYYSPQEQREIYQDDAVVKKERSDQPGPR